MIGSRGIRIGRQVGRGLGMAAIAVVAVGSVCSAGNSDILVAGRRMRLRDTPDVNRRTSIVRLVDKAIDLTNVNPTITGATVQLFSPITGQQITIALAASLWESKNGGKRFRYRSNDDPHLVVRLVNGRLIQFRSYGLFAAPLGQPQGDMVVRVTIGAVRFCAEFGGTIVFDDDTRFVGVRAPRPEFCPALTEPTTSTTTRTATTITETTTTDTTTTETTTSTTAAPTCGDGDCLEGEDAFNCYEDCGDCGDQVCSGPENIETCPVDCSLMCFGLCSEV